MAGVLAMSSNATATLLLARWLHGAPAPDALLGTGLRTLLVAVGSALLALALPLPASDGATWDSGLALLARGTAFSLCAWVCIRGFGDEAMRSALDRLLDVARLRRS